jgi:hypothetical protein
MAHYLGKIDFNKLIGVKIADVDMYGRKVKCMVVPLEDNGIQIWNDELQLWFRAFAYREKRGKFSHFLMKHIPMKDIKKLSAKQIETFANNSIGAMMKTGAKEDNENETLNF